MGDKFQPQGPPVPAPPVALPLPANAAQEAGGNLAAIAGEALFAAAVTAPNTAPVPADRAVVVALSPNGAVSYNDPAWEIARTNAWRGVAASCMTVIGRRAGFTSISVLNDVVEFGVVEVTELVGTEPLEIVSSSALDTALGVGARTVRITYVRAADGAQTHVDVALNGVTAVPLGVGVRALAIQFAEVLSLGTNTVSAGNIDVRIVAGSTIVERISAGGNCSLSCRFMVPAGFNGYVSVWHVSAVNNDQDTRLRMTCLKDGPVVNHYIFHDMIYAPPNTALATTLGVYIVMPPLTKFKVSTISAATGGAVRCSVSIDVHLVAVPPP